MNQIAHSMRLTKKFRHEMVRVEGLRSVRSIDKQPPASVVSALLVKASGGGGVEYVQSTPSSAWVFNHNLGRRPIVSVFSMGGSEVLAEVLHISTNQAQILFDSPISGYAIAN